MENNDKQLKDGGIPEVLTHEPLEQVEHVVRLSTTGRAALAKHIGAPCAHFSPEGPLQEDPWGASLFRKANSPEEEAQERLEHEQEVRVREERQRGKEETIRFLVEQDVRLAREWTVQQKADFGLKGQFLFFDRGEELSAPLRDALGYLQLPHIRVQVEESNENKSGRPFVRSFSGLVDILKVITVYGRKIVSFELPDEQLVYGESDILKVTDEDGRIHVVKLRDFRHRDCSEAEALKALGRIEKIPQLEGEGELAVTDDYGESVQMQCLITDFFAGYRSLCALEKDNSFKISLQQVFEVMSKLLKIVRNINSKGWAWADASPGNVLLSGDLDVACIDFGIAAQLGTRHLLRGTAGFFNFGMERFHEHIVYSERREVFAMRAIFTYLLLLLRKNSELIKSQREGREDIISREVVEGHGVVTNLQRKTRIGIVRIINGGRFDSLVALEEAIHEVHQLVSADNEAHERGEFVVVPTEGVEVFDAELAGRLQANLIVAREILGESFNYLLSLRERSLAGEAVIPTALQVHFENLLDLIHRAGLEGTKAINWAKMVSSPPGDEEDEKTRESFPWPVQEGEGFYNRDGGEPIPLSEIAEVGIKRP